MRGQWVSSYSGSTDGGFFLNVDERASYFDGVMCLILHKNENKFPALVVGFSTTDKSNEFFCRAKWIKFVDLDTQEIKSLEAIKALFPNNPLVPNGLDIKGSWQGASLSISWKDGIGMFGSCTMTMPERDRPSELVSKVVSWAEYKEEVLKLEGNHFLFRGQEKAWRLRTSFHRGRRYNLMRYLDEDMPMLHKHLSSRTRHVFDLSVPDENGAFLNLLQHHGYPTPLLDWSYSPYVAAFFAFRGVTNSKAEDSGPDDNVRIIIFDHERWRRELHQIQVIFTPTPHLSVGEFVAIENDRMVPQQAACTVTNIDDIEDYVLWRSGEQKNKYLWALDIPIKERSKVVHELRYMGITAGSLFPGLDGSCEELKERNFQL